MMSNISADCIQQISQQTQVFLDAFLKIYRDRSIYIWRIELLALWISSLKICGETTHPKYEKR